jgi:hypothetical protein
MHSTLNTSNAILGWKGKSIVSSITSFITFLIGGWTY